MTRGAPTGWTGGPYSLVRVTAGSCWVAASVTRALGTSEVAAAAWWLLAVLACAFAAGVFDRAAALALAAIVIVFGEWGGMDRSGASVLLAFALVLHACLPAQPYGTWLARGRADPAGGWTFPRAVQNAAWIGIGVALAVHAARVLVVWTSGVPVGADRRRWIVAANWWDAPALAWALVAVAITWVVFGWSSRARPFVWLAAALVFVIACACAPRELYALTWLFALVYAADPAWIRAREPEVTERLFYDGACGLCQRGVRFVLAEDASRTRFRFAPLGGETFEREIAAHARATLPDSVVVQRADGQLLVRSEAALHVLERLGGLWRVLGTSLRIVPRPVRDFAYDRLASVRLYLFARPKSACPLGPREVTARFDP